MYHFGIFKHLQLRALLTLTHVVLRAPKAVELINKALKKTWESDLSLKQDEKEWKIMCTSSKRYLRYDSFNLRSCIALLSVYC